MKGRNLIYLCLAGIVLAAIAYLTSERRQELIQREESGGGYALEKLQDPDVLNGIASVSFESVGSTITVSKADADWVAPGKHGYKVEFDKVREFLRALSGVKTGQAVPPDRREFQDLRLLPPSDASAATNGNAGVLVRLRDEAGAEVASIVIGKEHERAAADSQWGSDYGGYPDGRYVAVNGTGYLVAETFRNMPKEDKDWLDDDLLNVSSADIIEITVAGPDGKSVVLKRPESGGDLKLEQLAENEEMDSSKVNNLANFVSYLAFADVADPKLTDQETGLDKPTIYAARTKKGQAYTVRLGSSPQGSKDRYARLAAAFEPPPDVKPAAAAEKEGEKKESDKKAEEEAGKKQEEREKLAKETGDLNAKFEKWTYVLKDYKAENVTAKREDLVKKKEEKKDEQDQARKEDAKTEDAPALPESKDEQKTGEVE